jgi:glycosyltransferase involved in cell wall biosynthesis
LPFGHAVGRWYSVLLQGLVERGHRVTAYATCTNPAEIEAAHGMFAAPEYDFRPYPYPKETSLLKKWQTLRRPFSYMIHPELRTNLRQVSGQGCDVLHLEGIWSGWLGEGFDSAKTVLNFHSLYDLDQPDAENVGWRSLLLRTLRRRAEHSLLQSYGTLLTLTPQLKTAAARIAPRTPIHVVPLGLDASRYPFVAKERRPDKPAISVIGSMNWFPSYSAAVRFLTRLWPAIRREIPDAKANIVGWNARKALQKFLPQPGVEVIENVPDMRPFFEGSRLLLYAPERGSGMKVKVLEAFAYGVPVVTTSDGVEGIPARDGVHAALSDDDAGLVAQTIRLLTDSAFQESIRQNARVLVEQHCNPRAVLDGIEQCYLDILERQRRAAA